jgi:hypothetical protein
MRFHKNSISRRKAAAKQRFIKVGIFEGDFSLRFLLLGKFRNQQGNGSRRIRKLNHSDIWIISPDRLHDTRFAEMAAAFRRHLHNRVLGKC